MTLEEHAQKVLRALGYSKLAAEANSPSIRAALRALEAEVYNRAIEDAAKWQPIETAPRDGSQFLAYTISRGPGDVRATYQIEIARWRDRFFSAPLGIPTHWMSLPPAPSIRALAKEVG